MPDVHDKATRSRNMAAIKGKNTKPELLIRSLLHRKGFRYRLHNKTLPGKPDLVFPKYNAVIFVHGCFWHGHDCHLFKMPSSNTAFWMKKITGNRKNDEFCISALEEKGYRVMTVWECSLKGTSRIEPEKLISALSRWLRSSSASMNLSGKVAA